MPLSPIMGRLVERFAAYSSSTPALTRKAGVSSFAKAKKTIATRRILHGDSTVSREGLNNLKGNQT